MKKRLVSGILVAILPLALSPAIAAPQHSSLTGQVIAADSQAPLPGARVHVADPKTGSIHVSGVTDDQGRFEVSDLTGAAYELGIEIDSRLYLVPTPMQIAPGETQDIHLAVNIHSNLAPAKNSIWDKPAYAGLIIGGGAVILGLLLKNAFDTDPVSPLYTD